MFRFSPKTDDFVNSKKLYVSVQTITTMNPKVAANTIPTAREEQDVVHVRGESRPALFSFCDFSQSFHPSVSAKQEEMEGEA